MDRSGLGRQHLRQRDVSICPNVPAGKVSRVEYAEIGRRITDDEFRDALVAAREAGLWRLDARSVAAL